MTCITITTWEISDGTNYDVALQNIRDKRMPALKELGASRVCIIRTSDRTSAAITEWPDTATRDAADHAIEAVRSKIHAEDFSRMTGEMRGQVVAEL